MIKKVSVSVITYNQLPFLAECLTSIISQSYRPLEIVVSDDCSTDGTQELIRVFHGLYPDIIKPIYGDVNIGITGNSNRALERCTGDYIAFCYGDDVFLPGKIEAQVEWFANNPDAIMCGHRVQEFSTHVEGANEILPKKLVAGSGPSLQIRRGNVFPAMSVMICRTVIPPHGFNPVNTYLNDFIFIAECLLRGGRFGYVDGVYARYRRHSSNITRRKALLTDELVLSLKYLGSNRGELKADIRHCYLHHVHLARIKSHIDENFYGDALRYMRINTSELRRSWKFYMYFFLALLGLAHKFLSNIFRVRKT